MWENVLSIHHISISLMLLSVNNITIQIGQGNDLAYQQILSNYHSSLPLHLLRKTANELARLHLYPPSMG